MVLLCKEKGLPKTPRQLETSRALNYFWRSYIILILLTSFLHPPPLRLSSLPSLYISEEKLLFPSHLEVAAGCLSLTVGMTGVSAETMLHNAQHTSYLRTGRSFIRCIIESRSRAKITYVLAGLGQWSSEFSYLWSGMGKSHPNLVRKLPHPPDEIIPSRCYR